MSDELEKFIRSNRDGFDHKNPDPAVLDRILAQMAQKNKKQRKGIIIPFRVLHWAAACLVVVGGLIAYLTLQKKPETAALVKTRVLTAPALRDTAASAIAVTQAKTEKTQGLTAVDADLQNRKQALLAKLSRQRNNTTKVSWTTGLSDMDSPASRIQAISASFNNKNTGNDVVDALVSTLNTDPNANVRLAALDGLARFYREAGVRKQLVQSLKKQQDPIVQIALIELLTRIRESAVLTELDNLVNDESTIKEVRDCAYSGIFQLRSS